jgi:hypothetical protein
MQRPETPTDPARTGWAVVSTWIANGHNPVEILAPDASQRGAVLQALQITTASAMGGVASETGGLLVDHGWIRILGGAGTRMIGNLASWNGIGRQPVCKAIRGLSVIAHDAAGGVFALDHGALGSGRHGTFYLCPDTLQWIELHRGYSDFLRWACTGDVAGFAGKLRWDGWEADVAAAGPDRAFISSPPRWTAEGKYGMRSNLRTVPMPALFLLERELGASMSEHPSPWAAPSRR